MTILKRTPDGALVQIIDPQTRAKIRDISYSLFKYVLSNEAKAMALLYICDTPQTPHQALSELIDDNPQLATSNTYDFEVGILHKLEKAGALQVTREKRVKKYEKTDLARNLFCPVITYALLQQAAHLSRCLSEYTGKNVGGDRIKTVFKRTELIKAIVTACDEKGHDQITLDELCAGFEFSSDNHNLVPSNPKKKRADIRMYLNLFEGYGIVRCNKLANTVLYVWAKEELIYPVFEYAGEEYIRTVVDFLYSRRNGAPVFPSEINLRKRPCESGLYGVLNKFVSLGHVQKLRLPNYTIEITPEFRKLNELLTAINSVVEGYVTCSPNGLAEMKKRYKEFESRPHWFYKDFSKVAGMYDARMN